MTKIVLDTQELYAMADLASEVEREMAMIASRLRAFDVPFVPYGRTAQVAEGVQDAAGRLMRTTIEMYALRRDLRGRANLLAIGDQVDNADWLMKLVGGPLSLGGIYRKVTGGISRALRRHPDAAVRSTSARLLPRWGRGTKWAKSAVVKGAGKFLLVLNWWMTFDEHQEEGATTPVAITRATTEVGAGVATTAGLGSFCAASAAAGVLTGGTSLVACGLAAVAAGVAATGLMEEVNDLVFDQPPPVPMAPGAPPAEGLVEDMPEGTTLG